MNKTSNPKKQNVVQMTRVKGCKRSRVGNIRNKFDALCTIQIQNEQTPNHFAANQTTDTAYFQRWRLTSKKSQAQIGPHQATNWPQVKSQTGQ
jgi:hypothetical protein